MRKGDESIEKQVVDWNPHGDRRRGQSKQTWKRTVLEEAGKWDKNEFKSLVTNSQMEMIHKCPMFVTESKDILLLLLLLLLHFRAVAEV